MDKTPKERIVFDEGVYYGDEGSEISIEDITSREGITVEEVLDSYTEEEIFENAMNMMDIDRSEELAGLKAFLDGSDNPLSSYDNPLGGNRIIARGSIGRWDGTRHGLAVYRDFDDMMSGPDSVFKDCEIGKVWDENGSLFIHGYHHDGGVDVEVPSSPMSVRMRLMSSKMRGTASRSPAAGRSTTAPPSQWTPPCATCGRTPTCAPPRATWSLRSDALPRSTRHRPSTRFSKQQSSRHPPS